MTTLHAPIAWTADGWQRDLRITVGADGAIASVSHGAAQTGDERAAGPVLPGMPNLSPA